MKVFVASIIFLCATTSFASVWNRMTIEEKRETHRALAQGAEFDVRFRVVDDEGCPVENAKCSGWAYLERDRNRGKGHDVQTDSNGVARVAGKCGEWVSVVLRKEGYYRTMFDVKYPFDSVPAVVDGKWQPYGETRTVVLKRIRNPQKMGVANRGNRHGYPRFGTWIGYDLEKQDWVAPDGNGVYSDMRIRFITHEETDRDFVRTMEVSFADNPYGGAYRMGMDENSEFLTQYAANTNAVFAKEFKFEFRHKGRELVQEELKSNEYLVFRTRSKVNPDGTLKSAHYGAIMGNWKFFERYGMSIRRVVFNPTPNDTNLEDAETARRSRLGYKQSLEFEEARKR